MNADETPGPLPGIPAEQRPVEMLLGAQAPVADCFLVLNNKVTGHQVEGPLTEEELVRKLTVLVGTRTTVFAFRGQRYHVSKGPLRFLLAPDGRALPLFSDPDELQPDESGDLSNPDDPEPPPDDDDESGENNDGVRRSGQFPGR